MKICPFMSHMMSADGNVLEIDANRAHGAPGGDVVVLGYDGDSSVGVKTDRKARTQAKRDHPATSHLYCLKETCRFYRTDNGDCTFDAILADVTKARKAAEASERAASDKSKGKDDKKDDTSAAVARELDKFWKFQTKSVAEMISSFGEVEKRQADTITQLKTDVEKRLVALIPSEDEADERHETMNAIKDGIAEIKDTIDARNDGFETLTTTVSDLVLGFDDSIKQIKEQWTQIMGRLQTLEAIAPRMQGVESNVGKAVENIDRLERNWAEMMELVRTDRKKDDSAGQAKRREAMKFNNLGVTSFHNGDMKLARDQFLEALKRDDGFAECYNNLGLVYTELGENERAADSFMKAIKLNPELHAAYNNLGYVYYKQGSYDRAVEMYNEALGRSPNNSAAHTNLGNAHFKLGHKDEARRAWKKAIELDPSNEKAQKSLKSLD